jgi:hypothetical protein
MSDRYSEARRLAEADGQIEEGRELASEMARQIAEARSHGGSTQRAEALLSAIATGLEGLHVHKAAIVERIQEMDASGDAPA